ncbi:glutathione S-transferase N-terminal domain-containing protein [Acanthopleuribacter pedis]|uniref:Glutathione S-transferase N-terminal domain-containing protein n=1 Tax=Acanthopleuribacter pedis TaxID=442870 RepID=A0A8J7U2D6_9BACT|nr:glutathione S-transferase N-terminal domain-containing protein [Acanthopleuribacter pedis]MBO1317594.1 glutathione S-transferase N-terminal domain-containing protein [Acanthopleuribacter pedis]
MVLHAINTATAFVATWARFGLGSRVSALGPRPEKPLEVYEFEGCPFCRKVREALTVLDLPVVVHPCPKGPSRYRAWVIENGGKRMFPYLVDPNTDTAMYESGDIVRYLFRTYGAGRRPFLLASGPIGNFSSQMASLPRLGRGTFYRGTVEPEQLLELYSYEASPYCRLVREVLSELGLPYLLHNVARGSRARQAFVARSGKMQVPYLVDPNTDTALFESGAIIAYLRGTYRA